VHLVLGAGAGCLDTDFRKKGKASLSCAVVPVVTFSGENSAASHASSARTRSMAHGGAGGSAEKILRLPILPEGSDRRHKQTARPWTLRRKPVPGANLAIITLRELAGHHPHQSPSPSRPSPSSPPSLTSARAQHDFGAAHSGLARSGKPPPWTHRSTTGQPRAPCHGTMSTHFRRVTFPAHTGKGKGNASRLVALITVGLAARPGRLLLVPAVNTFRAQASRRGAFATLQCWSIAPRSIR
jgi:hypothetical protein